MHDIKDYTSEYKKVYKDASDVVKKEGNGLYDNLRNANDLLQHIQPPPPAQVPIGDPWFGFYGSDNLVNGESVDPRDCDRYPDSPWCGGNPISDLPAGFEPDWGVDECGAWVQITPVLGFIKLPPVSLGYRRPGKCREEPKPPPPDVEADITEDRPVNPLQFPPGIDPNTIVFVVIVQTYSLAYVYQDGFTFYDGRARYSISVSNAGLASTSYPPRDDAPAYYYYNPPKVPICSASIKRSFSTFSLSYDSKGEPVIDSDSSSGVYTGNITYDQPDVTYDGRFFGLRKLTGQYKLTHIAEGARLYLSPPDYFAPGSFVLYGSYGEIVKAWNNYVVDIQQSITGLHVIYKGEYEVAYISTPTRQLSALPLDQIRKRKCCMQCCSSQQQQNRQNQDNAELLALLRKIDKKLGNYPFNAILFDANDEQQGAQTRNETVRDVAAGLELGIRRTEQVAKHVGVDQFPIHLPSTIIQDESHGFLGDLGNLKNKIFKQKVESVAELIAWKIANDNEVHGQWQEVIEVEDADPTKPGNQKKRVVLPNMARSFRELILLNSIQIKAVGFILDTTLKMYVDLANAKVSVATIEAIIRDIQDYLDYPTIEKYIDVPIGIRIPKENDHPDDKEDIERFLQNSHVKAKFDDWTGEGSIHDMLVVLLEAASMIRAAFYNKA
jgi:hypothetical protein